MRRFVGIVFFIMLLLLQGCGGSSSGSGGGVQGKGEWTILVYMNAANNLYQASPINIEQMQQAASNPNVRIVVQWKQSEALNPGSTFDGTRRYLITPGSSSAVTSRLISNLGTGVDMGSPQTLNSFIAWGVSTFPASRYALVLWDHGNGWRPKTRPGTPAVSQKAPAFSYDDQTGSAIQIWQLPQALGSQHLDMIAWDCSLMQMCEVAYELRSNTQYVVGSEESPPGTGFPYDTILANFQNSPTSSTLQLAESWVDGMNGDPSYDLDPIEESVIDTGKLAALSASGGPIDVFAGALASNVAAVTSTTNTVRTEGKSYDTVQNPPRYFYDLYDMANLYQSLSSVPSVQSAAASVMAGVNTAVVYEEHNSFSPGSHGVSIDFTPGADFASSITQYSELAFAEQNRWVQWLSVAP